MIVIRRAIKIKFGGEKKKSVKFTSDTFSLLREREREKKRTLSADSLCPKIPGILSSLVLSRSLWLSD